MNKIQYTSNLHDICKYFDVCILPPAASIEFKRIYRTLLLLLGTGKNTLYLQNLVKVTNLLKMGHRRALLFILKGLYEFEMFRRQASSKINGFNPKKETARELNFKPDMEMVFRYCKFNEAIEKECFLYLATYILEQNLYLLNLDSIDAFVFGLPG